MRNAVDYFEKAYALCDNERDQSFLKKKIEKLVTVSGSQL